jgi:hypothetical protein
MINNNLNILKVPINITKGAIGRSVEGTSSGAVLL